MTRRKWLDEAGFLGVVAIALYPLWLVAHPPLQDLPQHLAAIRVLHSHADPRFALAPYFTVELLRTQYLAYYVAADLLAYVLDVELANRVLLTLSLAAIPYGMRALLRSLGSNGWLALFSLPLLFNAHLVLGFFNFMAAIGPSLFACALAADERAAPSRWRLPMVAGLLVLAFYTHVIPFAFGALGVGLLGLARDRRTLRRFALTLAPGGLAMGLWTLSSPAGRATLGAAQGDAGQTLGPVFRTAAQAWDAIPMWMTDVLRNDTDDELHLGVMWLLLAALGFGLGMRWTGATAANHRALRLMPLPVLAALGYFVLPESYDWIWPIAPRFALLTMLLAIPLLPALPKSIAALVAVALTLLTAQRSVALADAFTAFERDEVGELDAALDAIPTGQRVAGLMFDRGSRQVKFSPFIHGVAYYQARKGGAVMFTFADFPQSPFRFREDNRPPAVGPRWEWMPERVVPTRDLTWYDYVLVRGGPGRISRERNAFEPVFRGPHWSVWKRR